MRRWIVLALLTLSASAATAKPRFPFPQNADQVGQNDRDLDSRIRVDETLIPFINVKAYGAKGNGSTDDTRSIQGASDACSAANSSLYFPAGVYISTTIRPTSNCRWFGDGKYISIIELPQRNFNPMDFSLIRVSTPIANWGMSNMGLVGNRAFQTTTFFNGANSGYGVLIESGPVSNIAFDSIYVSSFGAIGSAKNTGGGSILVAPAHCPDSSITNFRVTNSVFGNNDKTAGVYIDGAEGVTTGLSRDIFITGNSFQGGFHNNVVYILGETVQNSTNRIFYNVHVDGNNFYNTEDSDADVEINGTTDFTVNNNNYVMTSSGVAQMVLIRSNCKNGSWSFNNTISYSTDVTKPSAAVVAFNSGEYQDNIVIEGNTIIVSTGTTGVLKILKGSRHVQVRNNIFISTATTAVNFVQLGEASDVDIIGNQFENVTSPIILSEGTAPVSSNWKIMDNRFVNCGGSGSGHISSTGGTIALTGVEIENNYVTSPKSTAGGAVFVSMSASANTGNTLRNNKIYGSLAVTDTQAKFALIENNLGLTSNSRLNNSTNTYTGIQTFQNELGISTNSGAGAAFYVGQTSVTIAEPAYVVGTRTNDVPSVGWVGESSTSIRLFANRLALQTTVSTTVVSITLTAGDWDIGGTMGFIQSGTTVLKTIGAAISVTLNTLPGGTAFVTPNSSGEFRTGWDFGTAGLTPSGNEFMNLVIPKHVVRINASTTFYLIANSQFTTSTNEALGFIEARRIR